MSGGELMANIFRTLKRAFAPAITKEQMQRMDAAVERHRRTCEASQCVSARSKETAERAKAGKAEDTKTFEHLLETLKRERSTTETGAHSKLGA